MWCVDQPDGGSAYEIKGRLAGIMSYGREPYNSRSFNVVTYLMPYKTWVEKTMRKGATASKQLPGTCVVQSMLDHEYDELHYKRNVYVPERDVSMLSSVERLQLNLTSTTTTKRYTRRSKRREKLKRSRLYYEAYLRNLTLRKSATTENSSIVGDITFDIYINKSDFDNITFINLGNNTVLDVDINKYKLENFSFTKFENNTKLETEVNIPEFDNFTFTKFVNSSLFDTEMNISRFDNLTMAY